MRISDWSSDVCSSDLAAAKPLKIAEFIADRLAGNRPPAFLAGHRRLHRQFLERRARRQAEPQRALLALVPADALADDVGKGMAEQMGEDRKSTRLNSSH